MKKVKMFFAVTALTVVTVGVFAGKSKFFASYGLFATTSNSFLIPIVPNVGTSPHLGTLTTVPNSNGVIEVEQNGIVGILVFYKLPVSLTTFVGYAYSNVLWF